jgi:hypothetical protein
MDEAAIVAGNRTIFSAHGILAKHNVPMFYPRRRTKANRHTDTRRRACTITSRQRRSADRTDRSPVVGDSQVSLSFPGTPSTGTNVERSRCVIPRSP